MPWAVKKASISLYQSAWLAVDFRIFTVAVENKSKA